MFGQGEPLKREGKRPALLCHSCAPYALCRGEKSLRQGRCQRTANSCQEEAFWQECLANARTFFIAAALANPPGACRLPREYSILWPCTSLMRITMYRGYRPQHIWIDRQVLHSPITANVLRQLPDVPTAVIDGPPPVPLPATQAALMTTSKKQLYLTAQQGRFIRECPGATSRNSASQLCCGYMIVDVVYNCNYDCTYCYLQHYVNAPFLTVYANIEPLFDELVALLRSRPQQLVRLGSGEFSDSLSLDPLTGLSGLLVPFLRQFPNVLFELKTKSDLVEQLLDLDPQGRVMVSWSLNPEPVVQREEHKTATLAARLHAAQRCRAAGYKIGVHFDPLLYYPGWEADYEPFVAQVFAALAPTEITYMSLGSLRFAPALKKVVQARFP